MKLRNKDIINYIVNKLHLIDEIHVMSDVVIYDKWSYVNILYTDIDDKLHDTILKIDNRKIEKFLKNISNK